MAKAKGDAPPKKTKAAADKPPAKRDSAEDFFQPPIPGMEENPKEPAIIDAAAAYKDICRKRAKLSKDEKAALVAQAEPGVPDDDDHVLVDNNRLPEAELGDRGLHRVERVREGAHRGVADRLDHGAAVVPDDLEHVAAGTEIAAVAGWRITFPSGTGFPHRKRNAGYR